MKIFNGGLKTDFKVKAGTGGVVLTPGLKTFVLALALIGSLIRVGVFYSQTTDTTKTVESLKIKVDTLQIEAAVNQHAIDSKLALLVNLIDPENGKKELDKIDKAKEKLLKELKGKSNGKIL